MGTIAILFAAFAIVHCQGFPKFHPINIPEMDEEEMAERFQCPGENEEFKQCNSSSCWFKTCETINRQRPCTRDCTPGCTCKEGYVREGGICQPESICEELEN